MSDRRIARLVEAAGPVSRETYETLVGFENLFRKWNEHINLAAPASLNDFWERHVVDSAQVFRLRNGARHFLDIGSGGGLPGVVISILCKDHPGFSIDLVESNRKKTAFLINALSQVRAPGSVHSERIEDALIHVKQPDVITARALASLPELLEMTETRLTGDTRALFHKGRGYREEIEESRRNWQFDLLEHQSIVDPESVILEISNLNRRISV